MTTLQGKSAIPEAHPLAAGVGALSTTAMAAHYLQASDTVLAVGSSLTRAPFTPNIPDGKTIVHATNDPIDINKEYPAAVGIVADAKLFLGQLAAELRRQVGECRAECRAETAAIPSPASSASGGPSTSRSSPMTPRRSTVTA